MTVGNGFADDGAGARSGCEVGLLRVGETPSNNLAIRCFHYKMNLCNRQNWIQRTHRGRYWRFRSRPRRASARPRRAARASSLQPGRSRESAAERPPARPRAAGAEPTVPSVRRDRPDGPRPACRRGSAGDRPGRRRRLVPPGRVVLQALEADPLQVHRDARRAGASAESAAYRPGLSPDRSGPARVAAACRSGGRKVLPPNRRRPRPA